MNSTKGLLPLFFFTTFLLLSNPALAADANGNYAVWGIGKKSCFTYTKARESDNYDQYTNYIKGFYTAFNMLAEDTYNITGKMTFSEILEWLDDYCELQQINPIEQALVAFVDENEDKRIKSPRKGVGR